MNTSDFFNYPDGQNRPTAAPVDFAFWASRSQRDWKKLLNAMQTLRFRPNETPITAGDHATGFYIVGFGRFFADNILIPEGNLIGEQNFFDRQTHDHTITVQTDGELLHMSFDAFTAFAAKEPELARDVLFEIGRIVSLQLRQAS